MIVQADEFLGLSTVLGVSNISFGLPDRPALNGTFMAMAIAAALKPTLENVVLAIALASWPAYARLARSVTLSIREENYIEAARAISASPKPKAGISARSGCDISLDLVDCAMMASNRALGSSMRPSKLVSRAINEISPSL